MSGSTIGALVGAGIGAAVGGPAGARWGWMIGSLVGGYVMPEKQEGPRLTDATQTTGRDGVPIPFGYGRFPVAGNVIWRSELTEHEETERQGKGGGPEVTTYTYTRSYAVSPCEGPIIGLLIVKENGKIVYDARTDAELTAVGYTADQISETRAGSSKWLDTVTVYRGDETQLPDATMEAVEGSGNVSAHRGLAYMVAEGKDVTDMRGAVPQYEFVVVGAGNAYDTPSGYVWRSGYLAHSQASAGTAQSDSTILEVHAGACAEFSRDGGQTWTECAAWPNNNEFSVAYLDSQAAFYVLPSGNGGTGSVDLWKATDSASLTFSNVYTFSSIAQTATVFEVNGELIVGCGPITGSGPKFYLRTTDTSWTLIDTAASAGSRITGFYYDGTYYYATVGNTNKILRSASLASGWSSPGTLPDNLTSTIAVGDGLLLARMTGGWYSSTDYGATWTSTGAITPASVNVHYSGGVFWTCVYVRAYSSVDNGATWTLQYEHTGGGGGLGGAFNVRGGLLASSDAQKTITYWPASFGGVTVPDSPDWAVDVDGALYQQTGTTQTIDPTSVTLATIVSDLFDREGLTSSQYDVSALTDTVEGFRVATEADAATILGPLMAAFAFDITEYDGKIRCVKRGQSGTFTLTSDDLLSRDGDAFTIERIQEPELLRKVTVNYIDPAATYTPTTQSYERRSGIVRARGEASEEVPIVCDATTAARIAERRVKVAWGEPEKYTFHLSVAHAALVPTDVGTYTDDDGNVFAMRLMRRQDESNMLMIEAAQDYQLTYTTPTATGTTPVPPTPTPAPVSGPTTLAVMNLPVLAETDDEVGVYLAATGAMSGWTGCTVQVSLDEGVSWQPAATFTQRSGLGVTSTALTAWASSEYPSDQEVTVTLPYAPATITYESLLRYGNRYALQLDDGTWEVGQFLTVTDNGGGSYTLSGLVRGRYATTPGAAAAGNRFCLIDSRVQFLRVERFLIGQTVLVRGVTTGTAADSNASQEFDFTDCISQTEWTPHELAVERDGGNDVTATWIGRARLGTEVGPFHSQYFTGYRVTYDDGVTPVSFDTTNTTYTYNVAASVEVTVAAINEITGAGASTAGISV